MNEYGKDDHRQTGKHQYPDTLTDQVLGERISSFLQEQAEHVQFTPRQREQFLRQIPSHGKKKPRVFLAAACACATLLVLVLTFHMYLSPPPQPGIQHQIQYTALKEMNVSAELAKGGQLISVDPTEQRVIYQAANQSGVFYMMSMNDPIGSNTLVMRYAQDMAWSSDGSALVATVAPEGSLSPLLALVPSGQYMHLLGHNALAATWSPQDKQEITYTIQDHGQIQLWGTDIHGQANRLLATMPVSLPVKHMFWSPDGQYLALAVTATETTTHVLLNQPVQAIYVVGMQTHSIQTFTTPANSHIGKVEWSPDGKNLAFEEIDKNSKSLLRAVAVAKPANHFAISPQHQLLGWSWSPDGRALAYSDGGMMQAHILYGQAINFSQSKARLVSPLWLKNGNILCMDINQDTGALALLSPHTR